MMNGPSTRGASCEATSTTSATTTRDARKHAGDGYVEALAEENATLRRLLAARERELVEVRAILASRSVDISRRLGIDVDVDVDDDDGYASGSWSPTTSSSSANVCFSRSAKCMGRQRATPVTTTTRDVLTTPPVATTTPVTSTTTNGAVFALESAFDKVRISPTNPFDGFANDEEDEASPSARRRSGDAETETETETENLSPKSRALSSDFARCDAHQEKTPDAKNGVSLRPSTPGAPLRHQNHQNAASADARARAVRPDPVDVKSIAPRRLFDAVA